jgi:hypothetical protein
VGPGAPGRRAADARPWPPRSAGVLARPQHMHKGAGSRCAGPGRPSRSPMRCRLKSIRPAPLLPLAPRGLSAGARALALALCAGCAGSDPSPAPPQSPAPAAPLSGPSPAARSILGPCSGPSSGCPYIIGAPMMLTVLGVFRNRGSTPCDEG